MRTIATLAACWLSLAVNSAASQPNLLIILADDLGYGDLGCTGSETIATPRIDALATGGVFCTQGYVPSSVCSPSRAGLITGRDPRRFGYEGNLNKAEIKYPTRRELLGLPPTEHTLGDHLGAAGYATCLIGKWHLGDAPVHHPNDRGFDYFCGMLNGGHTYFPLKNGSHLQRNGELVQEFSSAYLTDFFTDEAIGWIDQQRQADPVKPWMMYLSYNAPHTPMEATREDLQACAHIKDKKRRTYAAMVQALDRGVGRVVDRLEEIGQAENTLVVFFSDNGGATSNASWNGPLSGAKGTLREGGVRVPMIWNWPGRLPAGRTCETPISALDLLPTFLAAANAEALPLEAPPSYVDGRNRRRMVKSRGAYDGADVLPVLAGEADAAPRELFWRLQGQAAVLSGHDKLIRPNHRPAQLFQPADDPGEQADRAGAHPERALQLQRRLAEWEAMLPTVPLWDSSPFWWADSAKIYEQWKPRPEPR